MDTRQKARFRTTIPESSVVLLGLILTVAGLSLQDSLGVTSVLTGLGVALTVAGVVYVVTEASESVRLALAFVAVVAAQLLVFGGVVQLLGGALIGAVVLGSGYTRLETE